MTTKLMSTHLYLRSMGLLHVAGKREALIGSLNQNYSIFEHIGIDLEIFAKKSPGGQYLKTRIWVGWEEIANSAILGEHEVDVDTETPWGDEVETAPNSALVMDAGELEATL